MSNEKSNPSNKMGIVLVGTLLTDVKAGKTTQQKDYATFLLSGENKMSYWVNIFDEKQAIRAIDNLRKGSVVSVIGEIQSVNAPRENFGPTLNVNSSSVSFVANFGTQKEGAKWGNANEGQQPSNQAQQSPQQQPRSADQEMSGSEQPPVDFDDDIPF